MTDDRGTQPPEGWVLAIDFGTTTTSAATSVGGRVEVVEVDGLSRMPSAVYASSSGELVVGAAAESQLAIHPERGERTPKRRMGDHVLLLGDTTVEPVDAVAAVLASIASEAKRRQGGVEPSELRLTHPARWGSLRRERLAEAARRAGLPDPTFVPEPVAAALHLVDGDLAVGSHVAVYDLGGGTFDTAVLRRTAEGFEVVGLPGGNEQLGGEVFDERLHDHVGSRLAADDPDLWEQLRFSTERSWRKAGHDLRQEVRRAKEALSSGSEYTIYVGAPADATVLVTRDEFEHLIRADVVDTVDELVATVRRAGLDPAELAAVNLAGGSSRIPLVTRLVAEQAGQLPRTWGDPKAAVALGAVSAVVDPAPEPAAPVAGAAGGSEGPVVAPSAPPASDPTDVLDTVELGEPTAVDVAHVRVDPAIGPEQADPSGPEPVHEAAEVGDADPDSDPDSDGGHEGDEPPPRSRKVLVAAAAILALLVTGVAAAAVRSNGAEDVAATPDTTETTAPAEDDGGDDGDEAPAAQAVSTVKLPDVVGRTSEDAVALLEEQGFVVRVVEREHGGEPGRVVDTNPRPGTDVAEGANVDLVVPRPRVEVLAEGTGPTSGGGPSGSGTSDSGSGAVPAPQAPPSRLPSAAVGWCTCAALGWRSAAADGWFASAARPDAEADRRVLGSDAGGCLSP